MITTRREFLTAAGLLAGALLLPRRLVLAQVQWEALAFTPLREGVWTVTGQGGNSLLVKTTEGPILIDTKIAVAALEMRGEAERTAGGAPSVVINTHHHADHTGGNFAFSKDARIIAHRNVEARLAARLDESIRPALLGEGKRLEQSGKTEEGARLLERAAALTVADFAADDAVGFEDERTIGGVRVRMLHVEPAHTDNDLIVYFPEWDICHAGDLLFNGVHPYIDRPARASTEGWQRVLKRLAKETGEKTVIVPGHGAIAGRAAIDAQDGYFETLRSVVREEMKAGKSREEIVKLEAARLGTYAGYGFGVLLPKAIGAVYDELSET